MFRILAQATKRKEIALRHKYLGHVCHCSNAQKKLKKNLTPISPGEKEKINAV
jgi:hypothetical protein